MSEPQFQPVSAHLAFLLLLFTRWRHRPPHVHSTIRIFRFLFRWFQNLRSRVRSTHNGAAMPCDILLGRNIAGSHRRSSLRQHCRTRHNNLAPKTTSLDAASQRIHNRLRRPRWNHRYLDAGTPKRRTQPYLMCSANKIHVMLLQKSRDHIRSKSERYAAIIL